MAQLALPLHLADHAVFGTFMEKGNEAVVAMLMRLTDNNGQDQPGCWVWGARATGKTHLLQAVCDRAGDRSIYIPLNEFSDADPGLLDGLASRELVCLDNIEAVVGQANWEEALFALLNQIADARGQLVVAANAAPRATPISLPDLSSRLARLPVFHLEVLADADRAAALQLRAQHRGLDLPNETASYLLSRSRRDMGSLYTLLDKLDDEALRAQRRLTIPFVRSVLLSG